MGDSSSPAPSKQTVLVTGFGPFATHVINASWEAVKELGQMGIRDDVNLVTLEIPVEYETVRSQIPSLWKEHNPHLVVHVGVSGIAKELTLEQCAHNDGYDKLDVCGRIPSTKCCVDDAPQCLVSRIDMQRVCASVNKSCGHDVTSVVSHDPGRYLCDFIYFTSLNVDPRCTAFIHVPPLDRPYSAKQLAAALRVAVLAMLDQTCSKH
jgi:pyroglutamyl-peptidase